MKLLGNTGLSKLVELINQKFAPLASPALTGTPTAPTPTAGDDSTKIATTAFVQDAIDSFSSVDAISDQAIATAWNTVLPAGTPAIYYSQEGHLVLPNGVEIY